MKVRSASSRLACVGLCLVLALAAVGCVTTQSAAPDISAIGTAPLRGDHHEEHHSRASRYVLKQDVVIDGTTVRQGTEIFGVTEKGLYHTPPNDPKMRWVLPPAYQYLSGYGQVMYGKRFGQPLWVRIDLTGSSPKETPSPYGLVRRIPGKSTLYSHGPWDKWVAIEAETGQAVFLDDQGQPTFRTEPLKTPKEPRSSVRVLPDGESFVVSYPEHDRIFAKDGTPKSPLIPPLWRRALVEQPDMRNSGTSLVPVMAVVIDAERSLYWPLNADGSIMPKPDDLLGLQPIKATNTIGARSSSGWLVWWQTPEGERCARVGTKNGLVDPRAIIESRDQAHYVEWELEMASDGLNDIRRRAGQDRYEVHYWYQFLVAQTFGSVPDAHAYLKASRDAGARAYADMQQRSRDQQKAQEAAQAAEASRRQQAQAAAAQARKQQDAIREFDLAMKDGRNLWARQMLLTISYDRERWTNYVKHYGLDPAGNNSSQAVSYARALASGADADVLRAAVRIAAQPRVTAAPRQMSDWEYFWHGTPTGVGRIGEGVSASGTTDALRARLRATEQQNFDAWMRGAQSWGARRN